MATQYYFQMSHRYGNRPRRACPEREYTYGLSDNEVIAVVVHVAVILDELLRSDIALGRQRVARRVCGGHRARAGRRLLLDAQYLVG